MPIPELLIQRPQPVVIRAEKGRLPVLTEPVLMTARVAESFPRVIVEQMPFRLRPENPIEKGRDRLKDPEYRRGSRSRGPCSACDGGREEGHHGGSRCRKRGTLGSNLKIQSSININRLPLKLSGL